MVQSETKHVNNRVQVGVDLFLTMLQGKSFGFMLDIICGLQCNT